jgi:hypothetical protein
MRFPAFLTLLWALNKHELFVDEELNLEDLSLGLNFSTTSQYQKKSQRITAGPRVERSPSGAQVSIN